MNLKEAFRYQNRLQDLMEEAQDILSVDRNVTKVENTHLRHKVNPDADDETMVDMPATEYADNITNIAVFLMFLLGEREKLSTAIREAKKGMAIDFDGEVSAVQSSTDNSNAIELEDALNILKLLKKVNVKGL